MGLSGSARTRTEVERTLYEAALTATHAPSILNTQPWRWRVHAASLDLFADLDRQITSVDRERRLLTISCGAALHHACVALRARGLAPVLTRQPDAANTDHLATIGIASQHNPSSVDIATADSIRRRRSDRRLIAATTRVRPGDMDHLRQTAAEYDAQLHVVNNDQRAFLATAARSAETIEGRMEPYQRELVAWTHDRRLGEGVPAETLVANIARPVALRDFVGGGETSLDPGLGSDTNADFLILATPRDTPLDWLRAGEALSAVWLAATNRGIAGSVLSNVIEVPGARALVGSLLAQPGHPQLVLRIGVSAHPTPPPASPRRYPEAVIDVDNPAD